VYGFDIVFVGVGDRFDGFRVRNGLGGFCAGYGFDGVCAGVGCGFAGFYAGDGSNWSRVGFFSCRVLIQRWAQSARLSCDMETRWRLWKRFHRHAKKWPVGFVSGCLWEVLGSDL